jgi:hypothetical protein
MADTKQSFGLNQIGNETPKWATWFFRIFFYVTSMTTLALSYFTDIPIETKLRIAEIVAFANMAAHSFSKMWGIEVDNNKSN